jgi:hypothetical protein
VSLKDPFDNYSLVKKIRKKPYAYILNCLSILDLADDLAYVFIIQLPFNN